MGAEIRPLKSSLQIIISSIKQGIYILNPWPISDVKLRTDAQLHYLHFLILENQSKETSELNQCLKSTAFNLYVATVEFFQNTIERT